MTDELHDGYRYNGEADDSTEILTMMQIPAQCEPPAHRYDVDKDGRIAVWCRCKDKKRNQMK